MKDTIQPQALKLKLKEMSIDEQPLNLILWDIAGAENKVSLPVDNISALSEHFQAFFCL